MAMGRCTWAAAWAVLLLGGAVTRSAGAAGPGFDPTWVPTHGAACGTPARSWPEAFVTGNGKMGAMVMGGNVSEGADAKISPQEETIYFSHAGLFVPMGPPAVVPDVAGNLGELRQTIRTRGYGPAMMSAVNNARQKNFAGMMYPDPFLPAFELKIKMGEAGEVKKYLRTEDFATGEVTVHWNDARGGLVRKIFISREENVVVMWLGPEGGAGEMNCEISVPAIPNVPVRTYMQNNPGAEPPQAAADALVHMTSAADDTGIMLHSVYREGAGSGYDAAVRVVAEGGKCAAAEAKVIVKGAKGVLLLARIEPFDHEARHSQRALRQGLDRLPSRYEELLAGHVKLHRALFDRVTLDLKAGDERKLTTEELVTQASKEGKLSRALLEKMYEGGRYEMICSSSTDNAPGARPPNMQGIWAGSWSPSYTLAGDYSFSASFHLGIASALSCNTPELLRGVFALVDSSMEDWQANAKKLFGARGILVPMHQSLGGKSVQWNDRFPAGFCWTSGAGELAHWYYAYYLYTGDKQFLAERAIPFMKQAALFYEDFLVEEGGHGAAGPAGKYRFSPSYSPEDAAGDNSTQDIMVARELLSNLAAACRELGVEKEGVVRWQAMLEKMPAYLIASNGELQEWALPGVMNKTLQRHIPHLYAVYQSGEFDPETSREFWKASRTAYQTRLAQWFRAPIRPGEQPGPNPQPIQDRLQMALCAAQFGEGETVWEFLSRIGAKCTYASMMSQRYEDGKTFVLDADGAVPEIVNQCLVQSRLGRLDMLPALPGGLKEGEVRGLAARGQITINRLHWLPGFVELAITSSRDQTVEIRWGFGAKNDAPPASRQVSLKAGARLSLKLTLPQ